MALIEFDHLRKAYPGSATAAVEDLNLAIEVCERQIRKGKYFLLEKPKGATSGRPRECDD